MEQPLSSLVAAIRSQPWAIMPDYLQAIELIAQRMLADPRLEALAQDGHAARMDALRAVAAAGTRLDGSQTSTVRNGVALVPMIGVISPRVSLASASTGGTSLDVLMHDMRVAQASAEVDRIVLLVDSPGGSVAGLGEAAAALRASTKPVTAFVQGMGASAAYWLASQAGEIVMDAAAAVGSIGVLHSMSRQEAPGADGRRDYETVSSNAPLKRPDPTTDEGRAALQGIVDALESVFVADVAAGRKTTPERVMRDYGRGAMVAAQRAVEIGMADRVGTLESLLAGDSGASPRRSGTARRTRVAADVETRRRSAERS